LCVGCITAANAQSTFTEQLQQSKSGEGKITVTQTKEIDDLVNGNVQRSNQVSPEKQEADKHEEKKEHAIVKTDTPVVIPDTIDTRKKIMKGYKINGYRVQVFAGGNSRKDRLKAEKAGNDIKTLFPSEPVYVHFYSPRWICRMGNYRTYEEAHEVLRNVKQLGYQSAIIVKGKITVQYP